MRTFGFLGALVIGFALAGSAAAQSALEGPLAAPDAAPVTKAKPISVKSAHSKKKVAHRDGAFVPDASTPGYGAAQRPQPVVRAGHEAPADRLDVGMKWNGSNDTARETRVQNYDGSAAGTGAEVGLKLHF